MSYPCLNVHPIDKRSVGGGPCAMRATHFAIDNRAKLGHVCRMCWRAMPADEQALYVQHMNAGARLQALWRWNGKPLRVRVVRLVGCGGWRIAWERWFPRGRRAGWEEWRAYSMTGSLRDVIRGYRDYAAEWRWRGDF